MASYIPAGAIYTFKSFLMRHEEVQKFLCPYGSIFQTRNCVPFCENADGGEIEIETAIEAGSIIKALVYIKVFILNSC